MGEQGNSKIEYFLVPTDLGHVYVTPLRDGQVHITTDYDRGTPHKYEGAPYQAVLTANRVACRVKAWMNRSAAGVWERSDILVIERYTRLGPASDAASKAIQALMYPAVAAWLDSEAAAPLYALMRERQRKENLAEEIKLKGELAELEERRAEIMAELARLGATV